MNEKDPYLRYFMRNKKKKRKECNNEHFKQNKNTDRDVNELFELLLATTYIFRNK